MSLQPEIASLAIIASVIAMCGSKRGMAIEGALARGQSCIKLNDDDVEISLYSPQYCSA